MSDTADQLDAVMFTPASQSSCSPTDPVPSHQETPAWFENLSATADSINDVRRSTAKLCMPFNDALGLGWLLRAPETIHITSHGPDTGFQVHDEDGNESSVAEVVKGGNEFSDSNSEFHTPDLLINTAWTIQTPQNVSLLLTPPINRIEPRFTPHGMLAETDAYTGPFSIPVSIKNGRSVTIEEGDVIGQAIPINRSKLLDPPELRGFDENSLLQELKKRIDKISQARSGYYRREIWVNKKSSKVLTEPDQTGREPSQADTPSDTNTTPTTLEDGEGEVSYRGLLGEGVDQAFFCGAGYKGLIPEPDSPETFLPEGYLPAIQSSLTGHSEQPTAEWIRSATELGQMFPLPVDIDVTWENQGPSVTAHGDDRYHVLDPAKVGGDHPFAPLSPMNTISHWTPVLKNGYSNLYISPLNHFQQNFKSFSGLVDSDRHLSTVNIPGKLSREYDELHLKKGMPVTQAIPIHRDSIVHTAVINREGERHD